MLQTTKPLVYRGSKNISEQVGINSKQFTYYVKEMGLPAFRIEGSTVWLALYTDLEKWVVSQRDKYLGENKK